MSKILVTYWSGTGNTEKMAEYITEGAKAKGAEVDCKNISHVDVDTALTYDVIAIGSPSMGAEVLEEAEIEPFVTDLEGKLKGRPLGIFGSYGWGDGEWMRNWADRMKAAGARLFDDGLMVHETPEGEDIEKCKEFGAGLASF
ncbi:MAG: flavodoxin [Planctomycetaceae bacterium]|nr:flavodoxin [Planctomycetaceae bacterium]